VKYQNFVWGCCRGDGEESSGIDEGEAISWQPREGNRHISPSRGICHTGNPGRQGKIARPCLQLYISRDRRASVPLLLAVISKDKRARIHTACKYIQE
jgi:hypothetical protein